MYTILVYIQMNSYAKIIYLVNACLCLQALFQCLQTARHELHIILSGRVAYYFVRVTTISPRHFVVITVAFHRTQRQRERDFAIPLPLSLSSMFFYISLITN